jgi:S1-C subfamily serine protease
MSPRAYANENRLDSDKGVVVTTLNNGYPAMKAELQSGDVILSVNDKEAADLDEFLKLYEQSRDKRETRVLIGIQRGRARLTRVLKLTYDNNPPATAPAMQPTQPATQP